MTVPAGPRDLYGVLGLDTSAEVADIRRAYRDLARKLHPDAGASSDPETVRQFKEVTDAYAVLSDAKQRASYDATIGVGSAAAAPASEEPEEAQPTDAASRPVRGADVRVESLVPFAAARVGGRISVRVPGLEVCSDCGATGLSPIPKARVCGNCEGAGTISAIPGQPPERCQSCLGDGRVVDNRCPTCTGEGIVRGFRSVTVPLPIGIDTGQVLRLAGQGEAGMGGQPPGDLYVVVTVDPHPVFGRSGNDLTLRLPVTLPEAVLGAHLKVPTLEGLVDMELPAATKAGAVLRLHGRGLTNVDGKAGDLLVSIEVETPEATDKKVRKAVEALSKAMGPVGEQLRAQLAQNAARASQEDQLAAAQMRSSL